MNPRRLLNIAGIAAISFSVTGLAQAAGAVYGMTNAIGNNQVVYWQRAATGQLTFVKAYATGGGGSGIQLDPTDSLGSQGSIALDASHSHLYAVNTETTASNAQDCQTGSISSFNIARDGSLTLVGKISSGGLFPSSLAVRGSSLYVLNAGGPGACGVLPNVTGFQASPNGKLTPIGQSTQTMDPGPAYGGPTGENCSGGGPFATAPFNCGLNPPAFPRSPAEIAFVPGSQSLMVTVKGTNSIYVFPLSANGTPGKPTVTQATGPTVPTYFGFAFDSNNHMIVAEPFGAALTIPGVPLSAVSSFSIGATGAMIPISPDVANGRGTSCWIAISDNVAFISNNNTSDISSYTIAADGSLSLLAGTAAATEAGGHPNDLAIAKERNRSFLYSLNSGTGKIEAWEIARDGSLTSLGATSGLPSEAGAQGLVAY